MASGVVKDCSEIQAASKGLAADMEEEDEEEDDLFEIDLEAVDSIPPLSQYYRETYFTAATSTASTLLANCLLPISDVSTAIPMVSTACNYLLSTERMANLFMAAESSLHVPALPEKFGIPFPYCGLEM